MQPEQIHQWLCGLNENLALYLPYETQMLLVAEDAKSSDWKGQLTGISCKLSMRYLRIASVSLQEQITLELLEQTYANTP